MTYYPLREHGQQGQDSAYAEYSALPEEIRALYTYEQWQWLSGEQKANLIATETEPDYLD